MMVQFDALMAQGIYNVLYNGGSGDIVAATLPFSDARLLAQQARALNRDNVDPLRRDVRLPDDGLLAQEMAYELLKEYRYMLTMQDVDRAAVPFPDNKIIEYPDADGLAGEVRKADQAVRPRRRPARSRPEDQGNPREARRADLDELRERDAAGRRSEVHQAGDPRPKRFRASRFTSIRSASKRPRRR